MLEKPDIIDIFRNEGAELRQRGRHYWCRCLLHNEKTASCKIDEQTQTFYCWGCNNHGDVIDLIQKFHNLSFKDALSYLGINNGKPTREAIQKIARDKRKRELVSQFNRWCSDYHNDICSLYRTLQKAKEQAKTEEQAESLAPFYHKESKWLLHIEILTNGTDEDKFQLYKQIMGGST